MARAGVRVHRGPARRAGPREGDALHRLRPDRGQPARRVAPADDGARAHAALRPQPHRDRGRRHRHDRRPERQDRRAPVAHRRADRREPRRHPRATGGGPRLRRPGQPGPDRQQRRLAAVAQLPRVPARHRQALHRQLHAGQGVGEAPHRSGRRDFVHRVQLPDAAVVRLPDAVRPLRLHAADGRQRPVGQHHRGLRSRPHAASAHGPTAW